MEKYLIKILSKLFRSDFSAKLIDTINLFIKIQLGYDGNNERIECINAIFGMGRTNRNRKRKKIYDLDEQSTNGRFESMNSEGIYINLARSLYRNGWQNETNLKVGHFPVTGRGIYSQQNFQKDDLLISLPITSLISIVSIADDLKFRLLLNRIFGSAEKQMTSQGLLALYLLYLKHTAQQMEYITTLPTTFSMPYFCNDAEINAMHSTIRDKIYDQREIISADFNCFQENFKDTCCMCCNRIYFCDIFNFSEFEWSFFAVNSRSVYFNLEKIAVRHYESVRGIQVLLKDEPTLALAPFLDLLNHSCSAGTGLYVKNTNDGPLYQLYTTVAYPKYEQLFISYGALDNAKLLTEYGFFVPNNKHDSIEIKRKDIDNYLKLVPYRIKMLIANENLDKNLFVSRVNGFSHNVRVLIYILCNASHATTAADENKFKKIIYGDVNELDTVSNDMKTMAAALIDGKIKDVREQCSLFNERESNGQLTERARIYFDYLKDIIEWLKTIEMS